MTHKQIILASSSPRRMQLLNMLSVPFLCIAPDVDESFCDQYSLEQNLIAVTQKKAQFVYHSHTPKNALIVAADTVVVLDGTVFSKPKDACQAADILHTLSGKTHNVFTAVHVLDTDCDKSASCVDKTQVTFRALTSEEIDGYISCGEWTDKAGAYGIQGIGSVLIKKITGCFFNVMGLPVPVLYTMLQSFGYDLLKRS